MTTHKNVLHPASEAVKEADNDPLETIKNDLTLEVGRTRAILHGLLLVQREETKKACQSDDLSHLIELAVQHADSADSLTVRLDEAITIQRRNGLSGG